MADVYEELRSLIIRGRIAPGVRVVENDIGERLGVSRTPAREAIRRLHQEGFLTPTRVARRTELVVAPLTADDLIDLYRLMAGLEGTAVLGVMDLPDNARIELARRLKRMEGAFEDAARGSRIDYDVLFELHNDFHRAFVEAGGRPRLRALLSSVRPQVDRYEWVYAPLVGPDLEATFVEHRAIIQAVRDGQPGRARQAVVDNWERGAERLRRVIDTVGERGDW